ncbi:MAG: hypothetical protein AB1763_10775 [Campylobacterota bacterium]
MNDLKMKLYIDPLIRDLHIPPETVEKGIAEYFSVGGLLMLVCFFLISHNRIDKDEAAYLEEIARLNAAKKMAEAEREEWLRDKYKMLKIASGVSSDVFSAIDAILFPDPMSTLNDAVAKLQKLPKRSNPIQNF